MTNRIFTLFIVLTLAFANCACGTDAAPDANDSWNVLTRPKFTGEPAQELETDVCVVGAGSGGIAAAIAAARENADVVLVERQKRLGGTSANAFVSNWEGGPGDAIAKELFERMRAQGGAGVAKEFPHPEIQAPMGLKLVDENEPYENSLMRVNPPEGGYRSVVFLPDAFDRAARDMLTETTRVAILDETTFFQAELDDSGRRVRSVLCENAKGETIRIAARVFIDATGDVWLCRALGLETMLGADARGDFGEVGAPEERQLQLNAISRCYLIEPRDNPKREEGSDAPFPRCAYVSGWLDGPRCVNTLAALPGAALIELGYDQCLIESEKIARSHWRWLQSQPGFENYELVAIAPMLGLREGYRVKTKYVLRESDLIEGWENQPHHDMIAVADHPCDLHGEGGRLEEVKTAYGVPYRCLIPEGKLQNILVACRGAGLSKIAAASCRLQRSMIQLGTAAGTAAAWAARHDGVVENIDVEALVDKIDARSNYPHKGER
ncbi:MAG: FAD-dependent oxidoreductase [Thermoguttaceae bacterium]|nr:FAD-dependent oxidoreductase [Thermoguttaceae bacterium]